MTEITPTLSQSMLLQIMEQLSAVDGKIGVLQGQSNLILAERKEITDKINRIDTLTQTVNRIAPLVDKHETKYNQTAGAWGLGKTLWAMGAGGFGAGATMLISWLTGKHP